MVHTLGFVLFIVSLCAWAAELIEIPDGVHLRGLAEWEKINAIEAVVNGKNQVVLPKAGSIDVTFSHEALCNGARYRVEPVRDLSDWVDLGRFCRKSDTEDLTFAFISDTQEFHEEHKKTAQVLNNLMESHPEIRFVVNGGDLVQTSTQTEWEQYRQIASSYYSSWIPVVPIVGNHDYRHDPHLSFFQKVYGHVTTSEHYYQLDYGNTVLIILNSNLDELEEEEQVQQTKWLEKTLEQASGRKTILVAFHHAPFTSGVGIVTMPSNPNYIRKHWEPLFKKHGTKLVLNGHEHVYERLIVDGVAHLVAGPAAGKMGHTLPWTAPGSQFLLPKTRTITVLTATKEHRLKILTYSTGGAPKVVDEFEYN
ncbi:MAG: metallophosphoesterase [Deltaproteobacteria bacterium]|nr:metallophosphoesterase [Deltaproteobacteria bacterium]